MTLLDWLDESAPGWRRHAVDLHEYEVDCWDTVLLEWSCWHLLDVERRDGVLHAKYLNCTPLGERRIEREASGEAEVRALLMDVLP